MYGRTGSDGTCPAARERFHRQVQCPGCKELRYDEQEGCEGCDVAAAFAAEFVRQGERKRKERQLRRERRAAQDAKPTDLEGALPWLQNEQQQPEDEHEIEVEKEGGYGPPGRSERSVSVVDKGPIPQGVDVRNGEVAV